MTDLIRYKLTGYDRGTEPAHEGEWVRYSDAADRIAALEAEVKEANRLLENARQIERNVQAVREHEFQRAERAEAEVRECRMQAISDGAQLQDAHEARMKAEAERDALRASFRVNMLRYVPNISHADIDALLAALTPADPQPVAPTRDRLWCSACRGVDMIHCAHPDECGNMLPIRFAADSWKSWIDDLPIDPVFQPGLDRLQDFITALVGDPQPPAQPALDALQMLEINYD